MRDLPAWVRALLVGRFVNAAGSMAWVFIPLYLTSSRGMSTAAAGVVAAAGGIGAITGNLFGGWFGDRFGMRPVMAVASGASALSCALIPFTPAALIAPLLFATEALGGTSRPVGFALVNAALGAGDRRRATAAMRAVNNAGVAIGPPVAGVLAVHHFGWIFVIDALTSVLMVVVVLTIVPRARPVARVEDAPRSTWRALLADPRMILLLASVFVADTSYRFAYSAVPWQLEKLGAAPWVYGVTITVNCVLIVLFEPWLAGRLGHLVAFRLIAGGYALVGLGWLVVAPAASVVSVLFAVGVVTVGEMFYKPTATAHASDRAPAGMHGRFQSLYAAASIGGTVCSPPLAGALLQHGSRVTWVVGGVLGLVAAAALRLAWPRCRPAAPDLPRVGAK